MPHFLIASYNIEAGKATDAETVETVGATNADIICLQEVDEDWESVLRSRYAEEYPYMVFHPEGAGGLGVMSKRPVNPIGFYPAPNGWHPAWLVQAETPAGWLNLLTVHLRSLYSGTGGVVSDYVNWGSDHRNEIQAALADSGSPEMKEALPRMVMGDFNEGANGDAVHYLEDLGFTDVLPLFHPGQFTWRHPSIANQFTEALDHVLYDEWVQPLNAYVLNRGNSDHIPVVAHFEAAKPWTTNPTPDL